MSTEISDFFDPFYLVRTKKILSLQTEKQGTLAEWLGTGLQNRTRRFESAKYLIKHLLNSWKSVLFKRVFLFRIKIRFKKH